METFRQFNKQVVKVSALSLVEIMIALAIISLVFVSLNTMTFGALKQSKKLEIEDKMLEVAAEGVEIIKREKDAGWTAMRTVFATKGSRGYVATVDVVTTTKGSAGETIQTTTKKKVLKQMGLSGCVYDSRAQLFVGSGCDQLSEGTDYDPVTQRTYNARIFGRMIILEDVNDPANNAAEFKVLIACIQGRCTAEDFKPIELTTYVYRTGVN